MLGFGNAERLALRDRHYTPLYTVTPDAESLRQSYDPAQGRKRRKKCYVYPVRATLPQQKKKGKRFGMGDGCALRRSGCSSQKMVSSMLSHRL